MVVETVIVGMMRIKNEQRWLARVIESQLAIAERIFILDDHSTDGTRDIARSYSQVTLFESPFEGCEETRDKNWLLEHVEKEIPGGSWVVCIDGDEELAPGSATEIRRITKGSQGQHPSFRFQVLYLWDSESQVRMDGIYANFHRTSMFRLDPGQRFHSVTAGGFHCGNAPEPGGAPRSPVKLLHYGYMYRADRLRKWDWYNSIDPRNVSEGYDPAFPDRRSYPHMVQGDTPIVPAHITLRHAGPLKLEPLRNHVAA